METSNDEHASSERANKFQYNFITIENKKRGCHVRKTKKPYVAVSRVNKSEVSHGIRITVSGDVAKIIDISPGDRVIVGNDSRHNTLRISKSPDQNKGRMTTRISKSSNTWMIKIMSTCNVPVPKAYAEVVYDIFGSALFIYLPDDVEYPKGKH